MLWNIHVPLSVVKLEHINTSLDFDNFPTHAAFKSSSHVHTLKIRGDIHSYQVDGQKKCMTRAKCSIDHLYFFSASP